MADLAWASAIVEENYQAIISESGGSLDAKFIVAWVKKNGSGFFLRDTSSPLDCNLFPTEEFNKLYMFKNNDEGMFRLVIQL